MRQLYVKIRKPGNSVKFKKLLSTQADVYPAWDQLVEANIPYSLGTSLDDHEWFALDQFSKSDYFIDLLSETFESVDFESLAYNEFNLIDYFFTIENNVFCFQKISKSRLVRRKMVVHIGEGFKFEDCPAMILNDIPDAIYVKANDILYFRKISSITGIFKGIDQLYREASAEETSEFLNESFITLLNNFSCDQVKKPNRKKIALAKDTLSSLEANDRAQIFSYIGQYCPNLKTDQNTFGIGSEEDLRLLLWGIEQHFYTTPVGGERRIANSVIQM